MTPRLIASLAVGLVLLTGCGSNPAPGEAPADQAAPAAAAPTNTPAYIASVPPAEIRIPAINAKSTLVPVGLRPDKSMDVPSVHKPEQAAWFEPGPEPGQAGPAVIVGHVDGDGKPGVFHELAKLKDGDVIEVVREDGQELRFEVFQVTNAPKDVFPVQAVFGYTEKPELRLVTCGGSFDKAAHSYRDNTLVFARQL